MYLECTSHLPLATHSTHGLHDNKLGAEKMKNVNSVHLGAKRRGFTLVELVIVVLVIGILTAVAAPKMMNTANSARINGTKQSLFVLRDALENFKAQTGAYPTSATITTATGLQPYLSGGAFPVNQITTANPVATVTGGTGPFASVQGTAGGWAYDQSSGEIRINDTSAITF